MRSLGAAAGSYPNPWDHEVFNLVLAADYAAGVLPTIGKTTEPF